MVDGPYKFIFYSCTRYIEKSSGIVVDLCLWYGVVCEFELCRAHNVQCYICFSHSLKLWGHETLSIHFLSPYSCCNGAGQGLFTLLHANLLCLLETCCHTPYKIKTYKWLKFWFVFILFVVFLKY